MRNDPYRRRSIWIEVVGILLSGGVLLGGAGYLLYHVESAAPDVAVQSFGPGAPFMEPGPRPTRRGGGAAARGGFEATPDGGNPLLSDRSGPAPTGTDAPFSKGWRGQATPTLTGPSSDEGASHGGGVASGGGTSAGGAASSGPAVASSPRVGGRQGSKSVRSGGVGGGADWHGKAQKLAGRARALSGQLGQLEREASRSDGKKETSAGSLGEASTASASESDDHRDVPNPPDVPIDDHLHWLVVAGLLWGIWRLSG